MSLFPQLNSDRTPSSRRSHFTAASVLPPPSDRILSPMERAHFRLQVIAQLWKQGYFDALKPNAEVVKKANLLIYEKYLDE